ncbi:VanZ family protein, partial [Lactobacillus bombi]|nr:VanZ family protein [Bombilactobacillus bombi]
MKSKVRWLAFIMIFLIIGGLFISSSMSYHQQTSVPFLKRYLSNKPFYDRLAKVNFLYAGKE